MSDYGREGFSGRCKLTYAKVKKWGTAGSSIYFLRIATSNVIGEKQHKSYLMATDQSEVRRLLTHTPRPLFHNFLLRILPTVPNPSSLWSYNFAYYRTEKTRSVKREFAKSPIASTIPSTPIPLCSALTNINMKDLFIPLRANYLLDTRLKSLSPC